MRPGKRLQGPKSLTIDSPVAHVPRRMGQEASRGPPHNSKSVVLLLNYEELQFSQIGFKKNPAFQTKQLALGRPQGHKMMPFELGERLLKALVADKQSGARKRQN